MPAICTNPSCTNGLPDSPPSRERKYCSRECYFEHGVRLSRSERSDKGTRRFANRFYQWATENHPHILKEFEATAS